MTAHAGARFSFGPWPSDVPVAEQWRALDRAVARWVIAHGGSPNLARAAAWASYAEAAGHSALPLTGNGAQLSLRDGYPQLSADEVNALAREPLVASGPEDQTDKPFVLDHECLYLRRSFLHECAVAERLASRLPPSPTKAAPDEALLDALFAGNTGQNVLPQRQAVRAAAGRRLFVLTGGPGTGKTTTVLRMLVMLAHERSQAKAPPPVIRICAPTGKAAQRLAESIRDGVGQLRCSQMPDGRPCLDDAWAGHLECALRAPASTLHRLLGSRGTQGFTHHAGAPVPADIVVVDEASMVDLAMMRALLEALRHDAVLLLVGDADQLTSVGSGSVLLDVVNALESNADAEDRSLVRLVHSFRADTALIPVNEAVRRGDAEAYEAACTAAGERVVRRPVRDPRSRRATLVGWSKQMADCLHDAGALEPVPSHDLGRVAQVLDGVRKCQLLCALREGEYGADATSSALEELVRAQIAGDWSGSWFPGRTVIVTRNDYTCGLFNGDVGVCLQDEHGRLAVWFEIAPETAEASADQASTGRRFVRFAPGNLPQHRGAAALTIHKSQGSEYSRVAVLLPPDPTHRILCRQLLYTGVSRAKSALEVWATDESVQAALSKPVSRFGALAARLGSRSMVRAGAEKVC